MKKVLMILLLVAFATVSANASTYKVLSKKLTVREATDINSVPLITIANGMTFESVNDTVISSEGDKWLNVSYQGKVGYVRTEVNGGEASVSLVADKSIPDMVAEKVISSIKVLNQKPEKPKLPEIESNIVFIEGEGMHRVGISLKDLNRITCPGRLGDPIYSKDKQMEVVRAGEKDLFVKISPVQTTVGGITETAFNKFPRELFIECSGMVYNLSLIPSDDLISQTVSIRVPIEDVILARTFERGRDHEALIADLIRHAYAELLPDGYSVSSGNVSYRFQELDMRLRYSYKGAAYIVEDWEIKSNMAAEAEIEESVFVQILKNPRAIALTNPRLAPNETSRLLVVRNVGER